MLSHHPSSSSPRPLARKRTILLSAAALLALLAPAAAHLLQPPIAREGDEVLLHLRFYDPDGHLLLSTDHADAPLLEATSKATQGPFQLPDLPTDALVKHLLSTNTTPIPLTNTTALPLGRLLLGAREGAKVQVPLLGHFEGFTEKVRLERLRGPFHRTYQLSDAALRDLTTTQQGDRLLLHGVLPVRAHPAGPGTHDIEVAAEPGEALPVQNTGFQAQVRTDGEQFWLLLDTTHGHRFSLTRGCALAKAVLPAGTYEVLAVDPETIHLSRSPTKWPQLIGRDLHVEVEVAQILR